jgi:hypothetical protein
MPRASAAIATAGAHGRTVTILAREEHPTQAIAQWHVPGPNGTKRRRVRKRIAGVTLTSGGAPFDRAQRTLLQSLAGVLTARLESGLPMPGESRRVWRRLPPLRDWEP